MLRYILEPAAFFAAPFAAYLVFLLLRGSAPFDLAHWTHTRVARLTLAGLSAAVAGLVFFGALAPRHTGPYTQAHIENGRVVPGHIE